MSLSKLKSKNIRGIFTDLDGTLMDRGPLESNTFRSLWGLKKHGFWVVIVSGRPAGWADSLMRLWPIDAIIFENGAGIMLYNGKKVEVTCLAPHQDIFCQRKILQEIFSRLKKTIPHIKLASDQPYRMFDFAIDFAEDPPFLSETEIKQVLETLSREKQITFKLSSIHVNYWVGTHTKVTACSHLIETLGTSMGISKKQIVFCGDSPNDEPLFEFFDHSVGVSNICNFRSYMRCFPRYILKKPNGSGFQELTRHLISITHRIKNKKINK